MKEMMENLFFRCFLYIFFLDLILFIAIMVDIIESFINKKKIVKYQVYICLLTLVVLILLTIYYWSSFDDIFFYYLICLSVIDGIFIIGGPFWIIYKLIKREKISRNFKYLYFLALVPGIIITCYIHQFPFWIISAFLSGAGVFGIYFAFATLNGDSGLYIKYEKLAGVVVIFISLLAFLSSMLIAKHFGFLDAVVGALSKLGEPS